MRKTTIARTSTAIVGATLLLGVAACSTDEAADNASTATDAVSSAANEAGSAIDSATNDDASTSESASEGAESQDLAEADLPAEITDTAATASLGAFTSAVKSGDTIVAEFANGWVVHSPETGAQPLVGKIGETWANDGGTENEVGLPTAGEAVIEGGWEQPFTNGTIQWTQDEGGEFSAKYV